MRNQIKIILVFLLPLYISCSQSVKINRKLQLDFDHPSISFTSIEQVEQKIEGTWVGYKSALTKDSVSGQCEIEIKFQDHDEYSLFEQKFINGKCVSKVSILGNLVMHENSCVFQTENGIITINYLSDKQLKLDDNLFERK